MIKGSCACGRIRYQTQAQPLAVNGCHCGTCQRLSGGPFLAFVDFAASQLEWTQQPDTWTCSDIAQRGHCKQCGSSISMVYHFENDRIGICMGTVVEADPPLPGIQVHIFLKDKAPWFVLPDDSAGRWEGFSPGYDEKIEKWKAGKNED